MSWDYRIIRHKHDDEVWYAIHEVYYRGESDEIESITVDPITVVADDEDGIATVLDMMKEAIEKPTLNYEDF